MTLVVPSPAHLGRYVHALERGWSPDNRRPEAAREDLDRIARDAAAFLAQQTDRDAAGPPILLPDGSGVPRLPGYVRWIWDGDFCGAISLRWRRGMPTLPPYCPGHIGYGVVPWKRGRGYATRALALLLLDARAEGLAYVDLCTSRQNVASQRVISANGGVLVAQTPAVAEACGFELRYRIALGDRPAATARGGDGIFPSR